MDRFNADVSYFNLEAYNHLIEIVGAKAQAGDEEALGDLREIKRYSDKFCEYVYAVDYTENRISVARFTANSTEEYQEMVVMADQSRRCIHDAASAATSIINFYTRKYEIGERVYTGERGNRENVSDFCLEFTSAIYRQALKQI